MNSNNIIARNILGDFIQNLSPSQEYLILSFSPSSIPLRQRWRNNCLSADFLADYLSTFFLGSNDREPDSDKQAEVKSAVSYIANELLENGMKYSTQLSSLPISIQIHLNPELIIFQLTNSILAERTPKFQDQIQTLLDSDPHELYLARLERNALSENNESGLGLLTMLTDYGVKLGWKFEILPQKPKEVSVTTMVQLSI
jgi:hypothetical protein